MLTFSPPVEADDTQHTCPLQLAAQRPPEGTRRPILKLSLRLLSAATRIEWEEHATGLARDACHHHARHLAVHCCRCSSR